MRRWDESRDHLDRAAVLALEVDDPDRLTTALSFQAYRAMRRDDLTTAASLSEAAARDRRIGSGLGTYLVFQRAEILARKGDRQDAVNALCRADGLIDHLPPVEELPPSGYGETPRGRGGSGGSGRVRTVAVGDRGARDPSAAAGVDA